MPRTEQALLKALKPRHPFFAYWWRGAMRVGVPKRRGMWSGVGSGRGTTSYARHLQWRSPVAPALPLVWACCRLSSCSSRPAGDKSTATVRTVGGPLPSPATFLEVTLCADFLQDTSGGTQP